MMHGKRPARKNQAFNWESISQAMRTNTAKCVYVLVCCAVVLSALFLIAITPQRYNLKEGDIAHNTITASKDVVDELSTARQRELAAQQVEPSYQFKENVAQEVRENLNTILSQISAVQQYGSKVVTQQHPDDVAAQKNYAFTAEELEHARTLLTQLTLADYQLKTVLHATNDQIVSMRVNLTSAVDNALNTTIREGYVNETIQYLQQMTAYKTDMNLLQNVVTPILRKVIQPNMVIDQEATEKLRNEARAEVEPVIYKQGQNIVLAREVVTANQLAMLRSLGMLDDDNVDVMMYIGGVMLVLLGMGVLVIALWLFDKDTLHSPKRLIIISLTMVLTMGLSILGRLLNGYLTPALLAPMMITGLIGARAAIAGTLSISVMVSALVAGSDTTYGAAMVHILISALVGGLLAVAILRRKTHRQQVLISGLATSLSNVLIILSIGFMTNTSLVDVFSKALWCGGSALLSAVLCIAFDPVFESAFKLATATKLLELSNPNHPLLRRLLLEAPGTYHHSIIVANLAEAAAEAVGGNPLLARAGAYFHDIGKLKRPMYFKENQMGDNPHEHINPYVSAAIVTAHTRDGLIMAQQARLPQEIRAIIAEHHGDTPVAYFYHKATQLAEGQPVDIADFRYDGKRPSTIESAVIMLADTVEAAVRTLHEPTPETIRAFIAKLVKGKLEDEQMSNAPLSLNDIAKISDAFSTVLQGVFHERIEYPSISPGAAAQLAAQKSASEKKLEAARTEAAVAEAAKAESAKPEPAKPEPIKPETVKPETITPEPIAPEPIKADAIIPDPIKIEPVKVELPMVETSVEGGEKA